MGRNKGEIREIKLMFRNLIHCTELYLYKIGMVVGLPRHTKNRVKLKFNEIADQQDGHGIMYYGSTYINFRYVEQLFMYIQLKLKLRLYD